MVASYKRNFRMDWVISGHFVEIRRCPLYPQKRTLAERIGMSALCQKRTYAVQQIPTYSITVGAAK